MNLFSTAVKRPVTTAMMALIVALLGFVSLTRVPIDLYPNIEIPVAIVNTSYPNVAPEEIETLITRPIEEAVGTVTNIESIQSITSEGNSIVVVQFAFGTDMAFATLDMREKVEMVRGFLPDGASDPMVVQIDINAQAIIQMSLSGADTATLQGYAEDVLKPAIERTPGVASVDIAGGFDNYVAIRLDTDKLASYGLSIDSLAGLLAAENINLPSGSIYKGDKSYLLRTAGEYTDLAAIRSTPIPLPAGGIIRLSDVADVAIENRDAESITKVNGEPAVSLSIMKQSGTNTVMVANAAIAAINELEAESPYDIKVVMNQADFINRSIRQVAQNGIVGGLLAVVILLVFLRSIRSTIVIGISIPLSIIATAALIYFADITLNMMTLGGLALGIGMLVDNSVVVLENIYRYVQEGHSRTEAAILGAKEVAMAVTASTLTTIAVFLPMVFVEGVTSIMFREFALTVTFSLLASLVAALTLIPMLASKLLVVDEYQGRHHIMKHQWVGNLLDKADSAYDALESRYKRLLAWSLHHRKTVVLAAVAVMAGSLLSLLLVGSEFIPEADEGTFAIQVEMEPGTAMEDVSAAMDEVVSKLADIESIEYLYSSTAGSSFMRNTGSTGTISGVLLPLDQRDVSIFEVVDEVDARIQGIPGVKTAVSVQSSMGMMVGGSAISIEIKGDEFSELNRIANEIMASARSVEGTRNVASSMEDPVPQVAIRLDRSSASRFGLTTAQVSSAVKAMLDGRTATRYKLAGDELDVVILGDGRYEESVENLKQLKIQAPGGTLVPLGMIAEIVMEEGAVTINRTDQARIVTVTSDISGRDLATVTREIQEKVAGIALPSGYTINFGGQNQEMVEAFSDLGLALILAILLVYMIIASQFESLLDPFIIMFATPLAFAGGILGLLLTNRTLNITSIIGFIMLSGIVVNNAIVLIDYIQTRRARGEDRETAILNAGPIRLRPILMTSLTTVLALVPLALGIGEGAEIAASMATVVIFGLLLSTLLTLVFIPVVYTLFDLRHEKYLERKNKKRRGPIEES